MASARPMLNPALAAIWRDDSTLQIGADPMTAVVLTGITAARAALLCRLDGSLTLPQVMDAGVPYGLSPSDVAHMLAVLHDADVLVDGAADRGPLAVLTTAERDRLAPDLAAWSCTGARGTEPGMEDPAASTLARRRRAVISVRGAGRVGATVVGLLAAAGVGRLAVTDPRPMRSYDVAPGGAGVQDLRQPRADAALAAARKTAPAAGSVAGPAERLDLEVLCPDGPWVAMADRDRLMRSGVPHLVATTYERVGVVGPLVVPGLTPCLRCLDLHRVDRDPDWPLVAAQLAAPGRAPSAPWSVAACDVVLATAVAAHAALAALTYLDDPDADPPLSGAVLELRPAHGQPRHRTWTSHPSCGCRWPQSPLEEAG